jgi:hypothetical protein
MTAPLDDNVAALWHVVAPIYRDFPLEDGLLEESFDLGHGVALQPRPAWFGAEAIPTWLGYFEKRRVEEAGILLTVERRSEPPGPGREQEESDRSTLRSAEIAVWIASGIRLRHDLTILVEPPGADGKRRFKSWTVLPSVGPSVMREDPLTAAHLRDARALLDVLSRLGEGERRGPLWVAVRMAALASDQHHADIAFTLMWVGLEALFGPEDPGETAHQIAERIALVLESEPSAARSLYQAVKKSYSRRSKVIHGRADGLLKKDTEKEREQAREEFIQTRLWLRRAICRIALDEKTREVFAGRGRDDFLAELAFGATAPAEAGNEGD